MHILSTTDPQATPVSLQRILATVQTVYYSVASITAAILAVAAFLTYRHNKKAKSEDYAWARMEKAEKVVHDIYTDQYAHNALRMIDGSLTHLALLDEFQSIAGQRQIRVVHTTDVTAALENVTTNDTALARTICHCFDTLFYHLNRLEIYLEMEFLDFDHVRWQLTYYLVAMLTKDFDKYDKYARLIRYRKAIKLALRFKGDADV